jgi:hypothetical protein
VVGGNTSTGTVTLAYPAPDGGVLLALTSGNTAATVPANITVPPGATGATFTITTSAVSSAQTAAISASYNGITRTETLTISPPAILTSSISLFTIQTPSGSYNDGPHELGVKFRTSQAANVLSIRYYKVMGERGSHTGRIWSATGTQLASVVFSNETASGWQIANLANPLPLTANTTYVVTVNSNSGYGAANNSLDAPVTNGILSTVADGSNGVYGSIGNFPVNSWMNSKPTTVWIWMK